MFYNLIRIREEPLEKITDNDIVIPFRRLLLKKDVNQIVEQIRKLILFDTYPLNTLSNYIKEKDFLNEKHFNEYSKQLPIPDLDKSFLKTHPQFEKYWDYKKNYPLRPEHFNYGSNREVWWKCDRGHSYKSAIEMKGIRNRGCPICYKLGMYRGAKTINSTKQLSFF